MTAGDDEGIVQKRITRDGFEVAIWYPSCGCTDHGCFSHQADAEDWIRRKRKKHECNVAIFDRELMHSMGIKI